MNNAILSSNHSRTDPLNVLEAGVGIIGAKLRSAGLFEGKSIPVDQSERARLVAKREIERIMNLPPQIDLFGNGREQVFEQLKQRDRIKPGILQKQLTKLINGLVIDKDKEISTRIDQLIKVLKVNSMDYSDGALSSYIAEGKRNMRAIRTLVDVENQVGYYQARSSYWKEYESYFRGKYKRRKIYDMVLDIVEILNKWYLPRITVPGTKYTRHRKNI